MTVLYSLAKGQLSRQYHYDFGLRALKAVLVMAGELKRGSPDLQEVSQWFHLLTYLHCTKCNLALSNMYKPACISCTCILQSIRLYVCTYTHI